MRGLKYGLILLALIFLLAACDSSTNAPPTEKSTAEESTPTISTAPTEEPVEEDAAPSTSAPLTEAPTIMPTATPPTPGDSGGSDSENAPAGPESTTPAAPEEITLEATDGLTLFGTFYPGLASGPRPGLLLLHMNGGRRGDWEELALQLVDNGYSVLTMDMRGHGQTGGSKDWDMVRDDLQTTWDYLTNREDVDASRLAGIGASIGANMTLVTAATDPAIKTIVLLSPGLNYFGVTTDDAIVEYGNRPALIVASEEDREAAESSRTLVDLASGDAHLEMYDGAGHGTNMFRAQPELTGLILNWLDQKIKNEGEITAADTNSPHTGKSVSNLPTSSLFNIPWEDPSPFQAGLIKSELGVLNKLPEASIYHMDLSLSPDLTSIDGQQEVLYTNREDVDLNEVYFHLYPNIIGGQTTVSELSVNGQPVESEYLFQNSVLKVPLSSSLSPGEKTVIQMTYQVSVPEEGGSNYGVFVFSDDVLALAHFYPQVAVFDDDGWDINPPSENADVTYADADYFLVRVNAPVQQVLVTSGIELDGETEAGRQTRTFAAGPVRDFYLASSDRYTMMSKQVGEITVNSYGFPEFDERNKLALEYAASALEIMGERFGPYPYTEFDVAPTPNLALAVEYPGFVVVNSRIYNPNAYFGETPSIVYLESSVAHEVGHQWFYNTVGNDQPDEPWVDESLTQYATYLYFVDRYGEQNAKAFLQSFQRRWDVADGLEIPLGMPAGSYEGSEYSAIIYGRGPLFFDTLRSEMGQEAFDAFLLDYAQQFKWDIATGEDLKTVAELHCNCDLSPLFADWVG